MPIIELCQGQRAIRARIELEAARRGVSLREISWLPSPSSGSELQTVKIVGSRATWHLQLDRRAIDNYPEGGEGSQVDAAIRAAVWAVSWPANVD